jgi:TRAP-type uncharacterized transport system substrate-binding protein
LKDPGRSERGSGAIMDADPALTVDGRLRLQGDWGSVNLTRTCGWLAHYVFEHTPNELRSVIYTGRGMGDGLRALGAGIVDVAVITPASFAPLALSGLGPFAGHPIANLRAIAVMPHHDAMIAVARKDLGFSKLADAAAYDGPLRVSIGTVDSDGFMGLAGRMLLDAAGVDLDRIIANGGSVTHHEQPFDSIHDLRLGRADIMISEAIMTPDWIQLAKDADVVFLEPTSGEQQAIRDTYGVGTVVVPAGYFPGHDDPLVALDYAGWLIVTTTELPDDIARLLARAVIEDSETLARQYRHLPSERSPLAYPIDHRVARQTSIPLHPAAEAEYLAFDRAVAPAAGSGRTESTTTRAEV